MTEMQINYRNLQESRRHNREQERLTGEAQAEVKRANLAREAETYRSNVATLAEQVRANQAKEQLQHEANIINQSHYERMDIETHRSNVARELETQRHDIAQEIETSAHNENVELETSTHNRIMEQQGSVGLDLQKQTVQSQTQERTANVHLINTRAEQVKLQNVQQTIANKFYPVQQAADTYTRVVNAADRTVDVIGNVVDTVSKGLNLMTSAKWNKAKSAINRLTTN